MVLVPVIPPELRSFAFDSALFEELRTRLRAGALGPKAARLATAPQALSADHPRVRMPAEASESLRTQWRAQGEEALAQGRIAVVILAGGMATRFGGQAKGSFPLLAQGPSSSATAPTFLSLKLAQVARLCEQQQAKVPVVVMDSFATKTQLDAHLETIDWMGIKARHRFSQSIMPRLHAQTTEPLVSKASSWPHRTLFCAPGHGDTLGRLRDSGTLNKLKEQGVEHLLVSNVDNLLASVDPVLVGAHLAGVADGVQVSIEAVPRKPKEAGGCVALLDKGPAIVESLRLPAQTALDDYPDFNTNTLWIALSALDTVPPLQWHPVTRQIQDPEGNTLDCLQFEQLIGELSEHRPSQVLRVNRQDRFLPVKRQEDLQRAQSQVQALIEAWHP